MADDEKAFMRRIHAFTQALDPYLGVDGVVTATLTGARELLRGRTSELWLKHGSGWLAYVSTPSGVVDVRTAQDPDRLERLALSKGSGILVARRSRRSSRAHHPDLGDRAADAISVPLAHPELEGALTVLDRLDPRTTFSAEDLKALTSMAAHAGTALASAFLLEKLAREAEEKEYQALHDSLTGLPNRMLFATDVEAILALRAGGDTSQSAAVMLLDLDSFKEVNDTLGHGVGDVVLKVIASRLTAEIGDRGLVARLGGDEYAVIVPVDDREQALREAEAVKRCVEEPIDEEGLLIEPRTSIGVAMSPEHGNDASTLLRLADVAMYSAKEHRNGITLCEAKHDHYSPRRLTLAGELRRAIAAGELLVTYQPQQDLTTGAITAVEALLRWNHRVHGLIPPDEFIPVAEQTGLIVPLTDYVLTETLNQQNRWARQGLHLEIAVNLSPRVVQDGQLPSTVAQRVSETGGDARRLTLELTETGLVTDHPRVAATLHQLAAMGVRISIDNFGTGYSSLSRLSDLPVNEVKIDRSFVFAMANGAPESVVRSMIDLGHNLGLRVVAEGVEELGTLERLRQLHCDAVQGYVLSRAVAANALEVWLADQKVGTQVERVIVPLRKPAALSESTPRGGDPVFERFTERARRAIVLAQEEAGLLNHNFIGTEHLLLGLIHEGEGVAAKAFDQLGISLEAVRERVEETMGARAPSTEQAGVAPPFTPRAKKVLELSLREALQLGHNYIGTEHILLGLVREGEGVAARVLVDLGADLSRLRQQVIQLLSGHGTSAGLVGHPIPTCPSCRRPLGELAHTVVSSKGTDTDAAGRIEVTIVCCPYCLIVLGVLPSRE